MDFQEKIRSIPASPGVYLYKNAEGQVIYVGKAKSLRHRVSSYFHEGRVSDAKTGTLLREAVDVDYIVVANNKEALALENHLIKQKQPRFNILLRDDKTYPYVKLTLGERFPRVYVTRRLRKDGSVYYGPYFPANLAYRIVDLIHRSFLVPSCTVDLNRPHPRPCLQYYIGRCLGPCVEGLTTPEIYQEAVRDVKLFLDGRQSDLSKSLRERMARAAESQEFERAAKYRDLISTVEQLQERNAELEAEVKSLKKQSASAPEFDANGNQKAKINSDGKTYVEKSVTSEEKPPVYVLQRGPEIKLTLGGFIQINFEDGAVSAFEGRFGLTALKDRFRLRRARIDLSVVRRRGEKAGHLRRHGAAGAPHDRARRPLRAGLPQQLGHPR